MINREEHDRVLQQLWSIQAKAAKQRNVIATMTQKIEELVREKRELVADLKWMKGEE
jgi:signal transduction histidine kinase